MKCHHWTGAEKIDNKNVELHSLKIASLALTGKGLYISIILSVFCNLTIHINHVSEPQKHTASIKNKFSDQAYPVPFNPKEEKLNAWEKGICLTYHCLSL